MHDEGVPFYIRVKKDTEVDAGGSGYGPAWWLFKDLPVMTGSYGTLRVVTKECEIIGREGFHLVGTRYVGREGEAEYLLVVTNAEPEEAIDLYRRRWLGDGTSPIETLFGALKPKVLGLSGSWGFDLEATHLRAPDRIEKLLALLSLAFIWAHLVGLWRHEHEQDLKIKKHGCLEKSFFRYGRDRFRRKLSLSQGADRAFE